MLLKDDGAPFEAAPAGTHVARLYRIVDLGTQTGEFQGKTTRNRKLLLTFELLGEDRMSDGRPFSVSRRFTASLGEKAALRAFLESWRGRKYTPEELRQGLDLGRLLGQCGLLNCVESERNGKTYINIASVSPLPKGMPRPDGENPPVMFDLAAPDWDLFGDLSEGLQAAIMESPEYQALTTAAPAPVPASPAAPAGAPAPAGQGADFDDDIPF